MDMVIKKKRGKKIITACLLLVCIFIVMFAGTAYAAGGDTVTLTVKQTFTSSSTTASDTFRYRLTALDTGAPMPTGSTALGDELSISGNDTKNGNPITYTSAGTYRYEARQIIPTNTTGYTYDQQVYTITVHVTNTSGGIVTEVIVQNSNGDKVSDISFDNKYSPLASDPSLMVDPPVKKTVSGNPSKSSTFTFRLTAQDSASPMPAGSTNGVKTITIVGSGEADFGTWSYTSEGTYFYTVSEVNSGETGYKYDSMVYTITDTVKDVDGQLMVTRVVTNASVKQVSDYTFINEYTAAATGPKTSDDATDEIYVALFCIGSVVVAGCIVYLIIDKKRKKEGTTL